MRRFAILGALLLAIPLAAQQQAVDEEYSRQIRQATTGPQFTTELVDHLPASATVPTPLGFHGYIAGAEGRLTYAEDVYRYMRAVEAATPRVKVFSIGKSEEGREMILVAVSSESNLAALDRYKDITRRLADPRALKEDEARQLIDEGRPFYYATGAMHSPETGSPEMLMELVYRLAVEETPFIRAIRDNVITLITPVLEVDGRNRQVDLWHYRQKNPGVPTPSLIYWGHYVAHDNNRDQIGLALNLSKNVLRSYFEYHPQLVHDLHESVPFLYVSTGTGPYNPALDPVMIDEWHRMAYNEVGQLTRRGVPGVWTHGFYDGWAPNYMFWVGMGRNTIGRFYETFGNRWPTTENRVVRGASDRSWFRPNPPLPQVRWSLRNNINYSQSGLLFALNDVAQRRGHFLEQFWLLGKRAVAKPANEGPTAWVFDAAQKRQGQLHDLMTLLRTHGIEVHVADKAFSITPDWPPVPKSAGQGPAREATPPSPASANAAQQPDTQQESRAESEEKLTTTEPEKTAGSTSDSKKPKENAPVNFAKGSFIVRMDQPYSRLADALLDVQYVRSDERVYDDTGWTLGYLKNVDFKRVANPGVLKVSMVPWSEVPAPSPVRSGGSFAIRNNADNDLARIRWSMPKSRFAIAEEEFTRGKLKFSRGTVIVTPTDGEAFPSTRASITSLESVPTTKTRELKIPRIAILHTWLRTQDEGWYRLALDSLGVPYTYISTQDVSRAANLRDQFDVILFPPSGGDNPQQIVNGLPPGPPLPWKKSELTPNLGVDETDDMRPGLGLSGVAALQRFVEDGGLLITVRDTALFAIHYGLARFVEIVRPNKLKAPGTILAATVVDRRSPVTAGYDENVPLYYGGSPIFRVGVREEREAEGRPSGRGTRNDPDVVQGRPIVPLPERAKPSPEEEGFQLPEDMPQNFAAFMPRPEDRPRVLVAFKKQADQLLLSGMLEGGDEIAGKPAVILAPRGRGHILLFAINPMWRMNTQGAYPLVMNAIMNWDGLR